MQFSNAPLDIPKFAVSRERPKSAPTPGVIFPGFEFGLTAASKELATDQDVGQINARRLLIYVFGELEYTDVFGRTHTTRYCGLYDPEKRAFDQCRQYNDAN